MFTVALSVSHVYSVAHLYFCMLKQIFLLSDLYFKAHPLAYRYVESG